LGSPSRPVRRRQRFQQDLGIWRCRIGLFLIHGTPEYVRSDNGPEFAAKVVQKCLENIGSTAPYREPGSPWENGYNESFNGIAPRRALKRRDLYAVREAREMIEKWR
jgi:transposase InsO family protein